MNMNPTSIIRFTKAHSNGNDFVIIDNRKKQWEFSSAMIARMAHRRYGIGFDQFMLVETGKGKDLVLKIFNQDGTPAMACGNGTLCTASLMMTKLNQDEISFDGPSGPLYARKMLAKDKEQSEDDGLLSNDIALSMGKVSFAWQDIPLAYECDVDALPLYIEAHKAPFASGNCSDGIAVNIGNPHCVFFCDDAEQANPEEEGFYFENHQLFPEKCNVEFVSVDRRDNSLRMRVWERGAGITLACGSGACASFAAAKKSGRISSNQATIHVDGGRLTVAWDGNLANDIYMIATANIIYQGSFPLSAIETQ